MCMTVHARQLLNRPDINVGGIDWSRVIWASLSDRVSSEMDNKNAVPLLFRDPITTFLHFLILTRVDRCPENIEIIIKQTYPLVLLRAAASLLAPLSQGRRLSLSKEGRYSVIFSLVTRHLEGVFSLIQGKCSHYPNYEEKTNEQLNVEVSIELFIYNSVFIYYVL